MRNRIRSRNRSIYTVVFIGDRGVNEDSLRDSLIASCTNRVSLSILTGIAVHRLDYVFGRLGRDYLHERGCVIFHSGNLYVNNHPGGLSGDHFTGFNR